MSENLLDMAISHLGSSGLGALGKALGLPDGQAESAFSTGAASVLAGMLNKAGSESGLGALLNMATNATSMDLSSPSDIFTDANKMKSLQDTGGNLLDNILGNHKNGVIGALASSLGLDSTKGGSLLRTAAPVIMSLVGKLVKSKGLNMSGLAALLLGQKSHIKDKIPQGLLKELDAGSLDEIAERAVVETTPRDTPHAAHTPPPAKKSGFGKWLWPLLIALGVLWALNMCAKKDKMEEDTGGVVMEQDEVVVEEQPADTGTTDDTTDTMDTTPPDTATTGDFAQDFRDYLANAQRDPNKEFPLTIEFPTDGSMPNSASVPDVQALTQIMENNPGLKIAIEGHTDSDGDAVANQQLSEERAKAVRALLVNAGIAEERVTAVGMGSASPVADNETEEGKQKNRRIVVKVTEFNQQ